MSPKWQAGPLNFSVANSYYESYQIGPPSAIRTPPPIACHRTPMNSLLPTTFWASYIFFSSYKHHVLAVICAAFWRFGVFFCVLCVLRFKITFSRFGRGCVEAFPRFGSRFVGAFQNVAFCVLRFKQLRPQLSRLRAFRMATISLVCCNRSNADVRREDGFSIRTFADDCDG